MIGAFFDVDGTLYKANMWRGLTQYVSEHGGKNRTRLYMARNMPLLFLRKLKLIDEETFRKPWVLTLGTLVHGWENARGDAALRWVAERYIQPTGNVGCHRPIATARRARAHRRSRFRDARADAASSG